MDVPRVDIRETSNAIARSRSWRVLILSGRMLSPRVIASDELVTAVQGQLDDRAVHSLLDPVVRQRSSRHVRTHVLDLSGVTFVTPFALVTLAAILAVRAGRTGVRLICPDSVDCRQYLAVSGFLHELAEFVAVEGEAQLLAAGPSWSADTVLPVTRLESGGIQALHNRVQGRLGAMLGGATRPPRDLAPILSTIQEACANVFQHARTPVAWLAAQRYTNHYTRDPYVEIAIADAGCGIRESLATRFRNFIRMPDGEVVERMLTEGLSRFGDPYGGGYWFLQDATRQLSGSFYLRSGSGAVRRPRNSSLHREDSSLRWPGTQLLVRLTCPQQVGSPA